MTHLHTGMLIAASLVWASPLQATLIDTTATAPSAGISMQRLKKTLLPPANAVADVPMPGVPIAGGHAGAPPGTELEGGVMLRIATPGNASRASPVSASPRRERQSINEQNSAIQNGHAQESLPTPGFWTLLMLAAGLIAYQLRRQSRNARGIIKP